MINPMQLMRLIPKAKLLVAMMKEAMNEYEQNIKKYNIKNTDVKEYNKLRQEVQKIIDEDKA